MSEVPLYADFFSTPVAGGAGRDWCGRNRQGSFHGAHSLLFHFVLTLVTGHDARSLSLTLSDTRVCQFISDPAFLVLLLCAAERIWHTHDSQG